jgi:predicted nucleic acid-binding protein
MATALLDTNAVSDLMRGHPKFKTKLASHPDAVVTSVDALGEIRYGLERLSTGKRRADLESRAHSIFIALDVLPVPRMARDGKGRQGVGSHYANNDSRPLSSRSLKTGRRLL